ncbi:hypothetical protein [Chitinivorax sp. B]|uniref:hypothetical protein n=1 Tax=Chitinivorax sp. B TaxID=2502235 RepID=UPI0010F5A154|nr:hypothetical protein [Chitinivorax sp. B]
MLFAWGQENGKSCSSGAKRHDKPSPWFSSYRVCRGLALHGHGHHQSVVLACDTPGRVHMKKACIDAGLIELDSIFNESDVTKVFLFDSALIVCA